ncbi:MAG: hypothetical protein GTN80_11060 [Nitrososphaeria archaeon]|nr:hypothetical protein [Nitrososphaeria archaeon]
MDWETKKRSLETGDENGAQFVAPQYTKPTVSISSPTDSSSHNAYTYVTITASVSSGYSISNVKYKVTSRDDFTYDSGFVTMSLSGGSYTGSWYTGSREGYFYVTVRAKHSQGIYGYDWHTIYLPGPI